MKDGSKNFASLLFLLVLSCSFPNGDTGTKHEVGEALPVGDIMMQAFYWDTQPLGGWWRHISSKLDEWAAAGISSIWLPPMSKGASGSGSMGYDPYDYYDFGDYVQKGSTGNRAELEELITKAHSKNIAVVADIVLNHNSGGELEYNPYRRTETWTSYRPLSGKFFRTASDFHPNLDHDSDAGGFGGFPDLDLEKSYTRDWVYGRSDSLAKYYRNVLGIDAWRFDLVKGFSPDLVKQWVSALKNENGNNAWAVGGALEQLGGD